MSTDKIGVGIIGAGGWAKYGHIPALQALEGFDVVAVSSRKQETADKTAAEFGIPHAFADEQALIEHPDVDLVAVVAPAPEHARLAKAVIAAGKDVYSEWPLTTSTAESEELLALAEAKGVRHIVGLQRRMGPSARYTRDLVAQGYVGKLRGVHMTVRYTGRQKTSSDSAEKRPYGWKSGARRKRWNSGPLPTLLVTYTDARSAWISRIGGWPKNRLYSRLN